MKFNVTQEEYTYLVNLCLNCITPGTDAFDEITFSHGVAMAFGKDIALRFFAYTIIEIRVVNDVSGSRFSFH